MAESALSRRMNEITGVGLFAGALLWLVALGSYTSTDPAWFFNSLGTDAPANFAGRIGAFMAEASYQLMGYAAFLIPAACGVVGWHYFWCRPIESGYTKLVGAVLLVASVAPLLGLLFGAIDPAARHFQPGGAIGEALAAGFARFLNRTGAAIVLLALLVLSVILSTQFSFGMAFSGLAARLRSQRGWLDRYRA